MPRRSRPACDCAGTAPGYPQHEDGCASRCEPATPAPRDIPADPAWTVDPNPPARPAEEPF